MRLHFLLSDKTYTQPRRPPRYLLDPQVAGVPQNISGTLQTLLQKLWWRFTAKSCPTLETPWAVACQAPLCPFPGIFQAQILERVTISSSRGFSWPRDQTCISCIGRQILCHWAIRTYVKWHKDPEKEQEPTLLCYWWGLDWTSDYVQAERRLVVNTDHGQYTVGLQGWGRESPSPQHMAPSLSNVGGFIPVDLLRNRDALTVTL